jgi:serine/threonine protein kinase
VTLSNLKPGPKPKLKRILLRDLDPTTRNPIARGGLGLLFRVEPKRKLSDTILKSNKYFLKVLHGNYSDEQCGLYFENLDEIWRLLSVQSHHFYSRLAIPIAVVEKAPGQPIGFLMREFRAGCVYTFTGSFETSEQLQELKIFLNSRSEQKRLGTPELSRFEIQTLIGDLLNTLAKLHERGIVVGDVSHSNLVVQKESKKIRMIFLDVDSFSSFLDGHPLGLQKSLLYEAPEEELGQSSLATDVFKAALLIVRLMSQISVESDNSYATNSIEACELEIKNFGGETLVEMVKRALAVSPDSRPTAALLSKVWNDELRYLSE